MSAFVHSLVYVAAAVVLLVLAASVWRQRATRSVTATSLAVGLTAAAWWSLGDAAIALRPPAPWAGIAALATYPGITVLVAAFVCLGRSTNGTGWRPSRRLLVGLAIEPALVIVVLATNHWHQAFYSGPAAAALSDPNHWQHAPLFWVHTAYSYALLAAGFGMVVHGWWRAPLVFRRQRACMLVASLVPALVNGLNLLGLSGSFGDPTPIGFALTGGLMAYAILRHELIGLAPIARDLLFTGIGDAVVALSPDRRIVDLNPAAEALVRATCPGIAMTTIVGRRADEVLARWVEAAAPFPAGNLPGETLLTVEVDGTVVEYEVRTSTFTDARGRSIGTVLVARDVSELHAQHRELAEQLGTIELLRRDLAELANRDPLTDLHNRRFVMSRFDSLLEAASDDAPLSVLMLDIDRFKRINDEYGHQTGDAVLVAMAHRLLAVAPQEALVARWGGEEFLVVLPAGCAVAAAVVAEELRAWCAREPFDVDGGTQRCTVSVGVATCPADGTTVSDLLRAADDALYAAKADGRNRVRQSTGRRGVEPDSLVVRGGTRP